MLPLLVWNVLSNAMFSFLKEKNKCLSDPSYDRISFLRTELKKHLETHPDAIISLQEFGKTERTACVQVLQEHDYVPILGDPSSFTTNKDDFTFWSELRDEMSTALFVKKNNLTQYGVMDITQHVPQQSPDVIFEPFTDVKGNPNGLSIMQELERRISLASFATIRNDGKLITIVSIHLPCVFYKPAFQALVIETLKHIASNFIKCGNDTVVFVGDFNIAKTEPFTGKPNPLWKNIVEHNVSDLLPPNFKSSGNTIKLCGYYDPDASFISNWNGDFKSTIDGCIVYTTVDDATTCVVSGKSADGSPTGMTESGPSYKYPSDHIPMIFDLEFI